MQLVNSESPLPGDEPLSLAIIASAVRRHWRLVVALPLVLAVIGGATGLLRDRMYLASASLLQKGSEGRVGGGAAALAQQFGVNLGVTGGTESPQFYVELLNSRAVLRRAVEAEYSVQTPDGPFKGTLIQFWEVERSGGALTPWHRAVDRLRRRITPTSSRETGVVQFTVAAETPALAEQIAARLMTLLNEFNLQVRQTRAQEEGRFIEGRLRETRAELRAAEGALGAFLRQNRQYPNSPELSIHHDRLQRNVSMLQDVYTSLLRSQEQTRIDALRDMPVFTVIDRPEGTATPQPRGTVTRTIIGLVLGLLLALVAAIVDELRRRKREEGHTDGLELRATTHPAWSEARSPGEAARREAEIATPERAKPGTS